MKVRIQIRRTCSWYLILCGACLYLAKSFSARRGANHLLSSHKRTVGIWPPQDTAPVEYPLTPLPWMLLVDHRRKSSRV